MLFFDPYRLIFSESPFWEDSRSKLILSTTIKEFNNLGQFFENVIKKYYVECFKTVLFTIEVLKEKLTIIVYYEIQVVKMSFIKYLGNIQNLSRQSKNFMWKNFSCLLLYASRWWKNAGIDENLWFFFEWNYFYWISFFNCLDKFYMSAK